MLSFADITEPLDQSFIARLRESVHQANDHFDYRNNKIRTELRSGCCQKYAA